jgi:hypothetical protein
MKCPKCGELRAVRIKRKGFFQKLFLPLVGLFPWECGACRFRYFSRTRGRRRKTRRGLKPFKEPVNSSIFDPLETNPSHPTSARPLEDYDYDDEAHDDVD